MNYLQLIRSRDSIDNSDVEYNRRQELRLSFISGLRHEFGGIEGRTASYYRSDAFSEEIRTLPYRIGRRRR